jgi:hypothetical protein
MSGCGLVALARIPYAGPGPALEIAAHLVSNRPWVLVDVNLGALRPPCWRIGGQKGGRS